MSQHQLLRALRVKKMSSLNSRLQLSLLNRKGSRNLLEKGFTLVELMIVIVIVGILSAVALPNFLSQTTKAKATECTSKAGAILSQIGAEYLTDAAAAQSLLTSEILAVNNNSELCTFSDATLASSPIFGVNVEGKTGSDLEGKYAAKACVNGDTGKRDINYKTGTSGIVLADADAAVCTTPAPAPAG